MGFYASYKTVFDDVRSKLGALDRIKRVVTEERFSGTDLPMAVVNMEETLIAQAVIGTMLACEINFTVIVFVMETEPTDWFTDIITVMGDVVDKILSDRSLSGSVKDVTPTYFTPGEACVKDRLYYGGAVRFQALMHFTP